MKRLQPREVATIVQRLALAAETVSIVVIVAEIIKATGCSRATAYRAVSDAFKDGVIGHQI
jgi:DNA invertase Pin-like site-specific DNA recombinase